MQDPRPDRNFGFLVHDVARLMRVAYDRRTRELGLTRSQWWVLNHLYFNEGITQSELADVLDIEKPTLGRLLDRLEGKGWLERRADPADRRAKRVYLTGNVQSLMRVLRHLAADLRAQALDARSDDSPTSELDPTTCPLALIPAAALKRPPSVPKSTMPPDGVHTNARPSGSPGGLMPTTCVLALIPNGRLRLE